MFRYSEDNPFCYDQTEDEGLFLVLREEEMVHRTVDGVNFGQRRFQLASFNCKKRQKKATALILLFLINKKAFRMSLICVYLGCLTLTYSTAPTEGCCVLLQIWMVCSQQVWQDFTWQNLCTPFPLWSHLLKETMELWLMHRDPLEVTDRMKLSVLCLWAHLKLKSAMISLTTKSRLSCLRAVSHFPCWRSCYWILLVTTDRDILEIHKNLPAVCCCCCFIYFTQAEKRQQLLVCLTKQKVSVEKKPLEKTSATLFMSNFHPCFQ